MSYFVEFTIKAAGWGDILCARPSHPGDDGWGPLSVLRGTPWERLVSVVDASDLSYALHGHPWPFINSMGAQPGSVHLPPSHGWCALLQDRRCPSRNPRVCMPGKSMPGCWEVPVLVGEARAIAIEMAFYVKEGRYVLAVTGESILSNV